MLVVLGAPGAPSYIALSNVPQSVKTSILKLGTEDFRTWELRAPNGPCDHTST